MLVIEGNHGFSYKCHFNPATATTVHRLMENKVSSLEHFGGA